MTLFKSTISRRKVLALSGISAASMLLPTTMIATAAQKVTILHATKTKLLAWAPSLLAEGLGYYKDEGLEIERVMSQSGPASLAALVSGSGTSLLSPPGEILNALGRGQSFKVLMSQANYQGIVFIVSKAYAEKHGITENMTSEERLAKLRTLKGIRIGTTAPGSSTFFVARAALASVGLDPDKDAQVLTLGSTPANMAALENGSIDGFTAASPSPEMVKAKTGAVPFLSVGRGEVGNFKVLAGQCTLARAADVKENPDTYAALVRADVRAMKEIADDPQKAADVLSKIVYPDMESAVWADVWEANKDSFKTPYVTKEAVAAYITEGLVPGITDPSTIDIEGAIDMSFVEQATKALGWTPPA